MSSQAKGGKSVRSTPITVRWKRWGQVLCEQLRLLGWHRELYLFFQDDITPLVFSTPNPKAFQVLMHFLFTNLNPVKAAETFHHHFWPLAPGDKKSEAQFRTRVVKWLQSVQKGEGTGQSGPLQSSALKEAEDEAKRLGPVLIDARLNSSNYISPMGEEMTVLFAKFAVLVNSVVSIRKSGSKRLGYATIVPADKAGKRGHKFKNKVAVAQAEADSEAVLNELGKFQSEEQRVIHSADCLVQLYREIITAKQEMTEGKESLSDFDKDSSTELENLTSNLSEIRKINREFGVKSEVHAFSDDAVVAEASNFCLKLSSETFSSISSSLPSWMSSPTTETSMSDRQKELEVVQILEMCHVGLSHFLNCVEKRTLDADRSEQLAGFVSSLLYKISDYPRLLKVCNEDVMAAYETMIQRMRQHQSPEPVCEASFDHGLLLDDPSVATIDQISSKIEKALKMPATSDLQKLFDPSKFNDPELVSAMQGDDECLQDSQLFSPLSLGHPEASGRTTGMGSYIKLEDDDSSGIPPEPPSEALLLLSFSSEVQGPSSTQQVPFDNILVEKTDTQNGQNCVENSSCRDACDNSIAGGRENEEHLSPFLPVPYGEHARPPRLKNLTSDENNPLVVDPELPSPLNSLPNSLQCTRRWSSLGANSDSNLGEISLTDIQEFELNDSLFS